MTIFDSPWHFIGGIASAALGGILWGMISLWWKGRKK